MRRFRLAASAALPIVVLIACAGGDPDPPATAAKQPGRSDPAPVRVGSYRRTSDSLYFAFDSSSYPACADGGFRRVSVPARPDSLAYELREDTLLTDMATLNADSTGAQEFTAAYFVRQGAGTGLDGAWKYRGDFYIMLRGALADSFETQRLWNNARESLYADLHPLIFRFDRGALLIGKKTRMAENALAEWNGAYDFPGAPVRPDSARYAIDLAVLDELTLRYRGRKSGETVTRVFSSDEGLASSSSAAAYSSNVLGHPSFTVGPPACDTSATGSWWTDFFAANAKADSLAAKTAARGRKPVRKASGFGHLPH